jgi:hypothetical protein
VTSTAFGGREKKKKIKSNGAVRDTFILFLEREAGGREGGRASLLLEDFLTSPARPSCRSSMNIKMYEDEVVSEWLQ